jgi:ribosome-associated protein
MLLDFGDVVVHVFDKDLREFYDLEGRWENAPVLLSIQ